MRRLCAFVLAGALCLLPAAAASASTPTNFYNGFETDTAGWSASAVQVASGTGGIASATGGYHAQVTGSYTQWGSYTNEFPADGYSTSVDVYLDPASIPANDKRFDWDVAVSGTGDPFGHRRDFVFNVGGYTDVPGNRFIASASNNAGRGSSFPANPDRSPVSFSEAGWYRFTHSFKNVAGVLQATLTIDGPGGANVGTWVLSDSTDLIGTAVGGNRYGWFATNEFASLAIDNSRLHVVDLVGPSISIVSPADGDSYELGSAHAAEYSCSDDVSLVATCLGTVANGANVDTATLGANVFTVEAADNDGNTSSDSVGYSVVWPFNGFFAPVNNRDANGYVMNVVKAGQAIPVKFSLGGNRGLDIMAADSPSSGSIDCSPTADTDTIEQTLAAGSSSLSYDSGTDTYVYAWKTNKAWSGTCRQLVVKLTDGSVHKASFKFAK